MPIGTVRSRLSEARGKLAPALLATADTAHGDGRTVTAERRRHTEELLAAVRHGEPAIGQACAQVDAALALLLTALDGLDAAAAADRPAREKERGAVRGALPYAAETARAVLTSMYELGSSAPLYESSRLGRLFRDGQAAAQHMVLSAANYELAGRTVIGIPANDPTL